MEENKNNPILAIKCAKCGAVYFAHALKYCISPDIAENIEYSVGVGDIPFITYEKVELGRCICNDTQEPETES